MARHRSHPAAREQIVVVGLGRFGSSVATTLTAIGHDVLAIDHDARIVQQYGDELSSVVQADATDPDVLRQLGVHEYSRAVVAIGSGVEASVLAATALVDLPVPRVWAKAISAQHRRILERVGVHHVVQPEQEMGQRVAHLVAGTMIDYISIDDSFVMAEVGAPLFLIGKALGETGLRARFRVTVVAVKRRGQPFTYADSATVVGPDDLLVVAGTSEDVERFVADAGVPRR